MWLRCMVVVVVVAGVWWRGVDGTDEVLVDDLAGCKPAVNLLLKKGVVDRQNLPNVPSGDGVNSTGSEVCGGGACCTPDMTEALLTVGKQSLRKAVSSTADDLLSDLTKQRRDFKNAVDEAFASSERRALRVLETRYPRVAEAAQPVLRQLYVGLRAGLTEADERVLKQSLGAFWDELFPPVYHSVLHTLQLPFTQRYSQCLKEARRVVRPWGPIPTLVGEPLLRGLHAARLMLHALDVGSHVLQTARNLPVGPECSEAEARLEVCGVCHGALVPPCHGLCLNVARGCLAPLAQVDGAWADLSGAVYRILESLQVVRLSHLLHQLPDKMSEAIMVAMEHGPRLLKKVRKNCSSPMYLEEKEGEGESQPHHTALPPVVDAEKQELEENLEEELEREEQASRRVSQSVTGVMRAVDAARHWWAGLPETHCTMLATHDNACWNGVRVAPYTKTTAGVGIGAQKYNPEVRLNHPDTSVYSLADKLRGVRRLVMKTLTWLPKSDSRHGQNHGQTDGSGSGTDVSLLAMAFDSRNQDMSPGDGRSHVNGRSPSDDDEGFDYYYDNYDDEEGSAYGSGDKPPKEPPVEKGAPAQSQGTASSSSPGASLMMVVLMAAVGAALQRY